MSNYTKWFLSFHNKQDNTQKNIEIINRHIKRITFGIIPTLIEAQDDENHYPMHNETNGCSLYDLENQLGLLRPLLSISKKMPDVILKIKGIDEYGLGEHIYIKNGLVQEKISDLNDNQKWHISDHFPDIEYDWKKEYEKIKFDERYSRTKARLLFGCAKQKNLIEDIMRMPKDKQKEFFKYIKEFLKKNA